MINYKKLLAMKRRFRKTQLFLKNGNNNKLKIRMIKIEFKVYF